MAAKDSIAISGGRFQSGASGNRPPAFDEHLVRTVAIRTLSDITPHLFSSAAVCAAHKRIWLESLRKLERLRAIEQLVFSGNREENTDVCLPKILMSNYRSHARM